MTKFLLAVRKAYDTKRIAFVIAFCAVAVFLYFAPFCLDGLSHFTRLLYIRQSANWWEQLRNNGEITNGRVAYLYFIFIVPAPFLLLSLCGNIGTIKMKWCAVFSLPLAIFSVYAAGSYVASRARMFLLTSDETVYSAFYIIVCLLVILAVVLILLAAYLPLKEPAPAEPKPERKRKPSKAERIAELEARVRELEDKERGSN